MSLMTRRVSRSEQGALAGANSSLGGLTGLYSPAIFSLVFSAAIGPGAGWGFPGAPFVLAAVLVLVALVLAWRVTRPRAS
jgi:DHA1 family tetracycline resistance protein-like MFS transporter